jgi:hypothetical protein
MRSRRVGASRPSPTGGHTVLLSTRQRSR